MSCNAEIVVKVQGDPSGNGGEATVCGADRNEVLDTALRLFRSLADSGHGPSYPKTKPRSDGTWSATLTYYGSAL
jgi:phenylacetate-coenzyme A ligase PaaK-like adenylate-forming protein